VRKIDPYMANAKIKTLGKTDRISSLDSPLSEIKKKKALKMNADWEKETDRGKPIKKR
jgi:hypothetical protein